VGAYALFILLGVVQGFTEFLPVSSSGHLVLLENLTGFNPPGVTAEVALHLATLIAVFIHYRRDIASMLTGKKSLGLRAPRAYLGLVVFATIITAGLVFPFRDALESMTQGKGALAVLSVTFSITALLMFATDWLLRKPRARAGEVTSLGWLAAAFIAVIQAIAALPGVSRSGSTIAAGIVAGLKREEAARFSFMLFIPISLLAVAWQILGLIKGSETMDASLWGPMAAGFIAALFCGLLAIRLLLVVLERSRLSWFGIYLVVLAFASFILSRI
jgi:undecaprenyl-diphosphatase